MTMLDKFIIACLPLLSNALSFPMEDALSSQKFNIIYVPSLNDNLNEIKETNGNGTIFSLGDDMKCFIPNETKLSLLQRINNNATAWKQLLSTSLGQGIDIIDSQLDHKCINQGKGFWKYQLCYGEDFVQYHDTPRDKDFVNKLGTYLTTPDSLDQSEVTLIFDNEIGYYISEFLAPGDVCDLTGKRREVEIQYVCGLNKESPTIQWVKEIGTCLYEARVMVPDLCQLELFAKNEDKLSATKIVCERSNKDLKKNGIIDIVSDFDPVFLNNEIFLLKPNAKYQEILLLYTGEYKDQSQMETILFDKFGQAFNKVINAKLLKGPTNEIITIKDSFQWYAPVIDTNANYLFTFYLKMLPDGKAELFLKPERNTAPHYNNNFISFDSNGLDNGHEDMKNSDKKDEKKQQMGLTLKNGNGETISVEKVANPMDQEVFMINIIDDNGEPIPMNEQVRSDLLKNLFETQNFQDMVENIRADIEDGGDRIQFLHPSVESPESDNIDDRKQPEVGSKKNKVDSDNLVRNVHVEDNEEELNNGGKKINSNSEDTTVEQDGEPEGFIDLVDGDIKTTSDVIEPHSESDTVNRVTIKAKNEKDMEKILGRLKNGEPLEDINENTSFEAIPSETIIDTFETSSEVDQPSKLSDTTEKRTEGTVDSIKSSKIVEQISLEEKGLGSEVPKGTSSGVKKTSLSETEKDINHDEL